MNYWLMMELFTSINSIQLEEGGSPQVIEMIQLSSWEWFLLLLSVILVVWLLLLFQMRSSNPGELVSETHHTPGTMEEAHHTDN